MYLIFGLLVIYNYCINVKLSDSAGWGAGGGGACWGGHAGGGHAGGACWGRGAWGNVQLAHTLALILKRSTVRGCQLNHIAMLVFVFLIPNLEITELSDGPTAQPSTSLNGWLSRNRHGNTARVCSGGHKYCSSSGAG